MYAKITQHIQRYFKDVFNGIRCFDGTFPLKVKPDSKTYQAPQRCVAYTLQKPSKEELEWLQQQDIITLLGIDETAEWYQNIILVLKCNWKVRMCLDPVRLHQVPIRLVHRIPTHNDIFPIFKQCLTFLSLIEASSKCHNHKPGKGSSYLAAFACLFDRYQYKRFLFGATTTGFIFQWNRWNI